MKLIHFLAGVLLSVLASTSFALVPADIPGVPKDLKVGPPKVVLDRNQNSRKRALTVTVTAPTPNQLYDWVETTWPELFPKGPQSMTYAYNGVNYTAVRAYSTGNALGVTTEGAIHGLGPFTGNQLVVFGKLSDFNLCQMTPSACGGGTGSPGVYQVDVGAHKFLVNYVNSQMTWLGAKDGKSHNVAPGDIAFVRFNSNRRGWGADSQTSTAPQANGDLAIINTCKDDAGLPTVITKEGLELWPDFSAQGYQLTGDAQPKMVFGMIQYGGYQQASVSAIKEADGTVTLVVDFTTNCAFGFGKNNKLIPFDVSKPLMFVWHSNKAGAGRQPGWGIGTVAPSIRQAYFDEEEAKKGHLLVKFPNMACTDAGGVTAYTAKSISEDGKVIIYDPDTDGFGNGGWLVVPKADDANPIWKAGSGVAWNAEKFQITWSVPICIEK